MKSYKDLDKEIILNAPEGAMWARECASGCCYYKLEDGLLYIIYGNDSDDSWMRSKYNSYNETIDDILGLTPLPNIEIPWEATADSVCPVPDGIYGQARYESETEETYDNIIMELVDFHPREWRLGGPETIISYKIIDEEFLDKAKPTQEEPIHVPELEMHRAAYQAIKDAGFESPEELLAEYKALREEDESEVVTPEVKLFRKLKFLQNLANQFPEIKDHVVKYMKEYLDYYVEDDVEEA